ncbi:MAG: mechanosensitive ion channel domain-containing protein [Caulobacteraceae bacterium]
MTLFSALPMVNDPLVAAAVVAVVGSVGARYWRRRSPRIYFVAQLLVFTLLTILMMAGDVAPWRAAAGSGPPVRRLLAGGLEIAWWLSGAWFTVGFLRAFVILRRQPRQAKLVQDLVAALVYALAIVAIIGYVLDLPVKGLLATSGVVAIVLGLALQSSLGDVFSGIVLNIERPYQIGDWVILDDNVQGKVIETNWRATHFLTGNQDVAIIPNSIIAKSRVVNCSSPTRIHGASIRVKLEPTATPGAGRKLLNDVLLGSTHILTTPAPSVTIKDVSAEMIDFEISYSVADVNSVGAAQNELYDLIYRAVASAGAKFSPRLTGAASATAPEEEGTLAAPERLLAGISLFSSLSANEAAALAAQMKRKVYRPGDVIVQIDTVVQALNVLAYGFTSACVEENGRWTEVMRMAPGDYFGELGLLAGEALHGEVTAITRVVIYEISKEALSPLLKARPGMAEELSDSLARRRASRHTALDQHPQIEQHEEGLAERVATNIRRLFSLHPASDTPARAPAPPAALKPKVQAPK